MFEKYCDQFDYDTQTISKAVDNSNFTYIFLKALQKNQSLFVSKLCKFRFVSKEYPTEMFKTFADLIKATKTRDKLPRSLDCMKDILNVNKDSISNCYKTRIQSDIWHTILGHPLVIEWIEFLYVRNQFIETINEYDSFKLILGHPRTIETIEIIELKCPTILEDLKTSPRTKLLNYAVDRDNLYFLQNWFNVIESQLIDSILNNDKSDIQLQSNVKSLKMIEFLFDKGWEIADLNSLLKIKSVSPVLIKYIIETKNINITLNHLKMRMDAVIKYDWWYLDIIYILLTFCNEKVRFEFYSNRIEYCDKNVQILECLQLLYDVAFGIKNINDNANTNNEFNKYRSYYSAIMKIPNFEQFDNLGDSEWICRNTVLTKLFHHYIQMETNDNVNHVLSKIVSHLKFDTNDLTIQLHPSLFVEATIIHNNLPIMKQILGKIGDYEIEMHEIYVCYKIAIDYNNNNQEMIDYLKNYIQNNDQLFKNNLKYDWGDLEDYRTSSTNFNVMNDEKVNETTDISDNNKNSSNIDSNNFNIAVSMNMIENSLIKLYHRYINNISNESLKNEFILNVYCNKKYFHNPTFQYILKSNAYGIIKTANDSKGIYLFHSIANDANMFDVLSNIINKNADYIMNNYSIPIKTIQNTKNNSSDESRNVNLVENDNIDIEVKTNDEKEFQEEKMNVETKACVNTSKNLLCLLCDKNGNIIIENIVFGSYNSMYQQLKYPTNRSRDQSVDNNNNSGKNEHNSNNDIYNNKEKTSNFISLLHNIQRQTIDAKFKNIV